MIFCPFLKQIFTNLSYYLILVNYFLKHITLFTTGNNCTTFKQLWIRVNLQAFGLTTLFQQWNTHFIYVYNMNLQWQTCSSKLAKGMMQKTFYKVKKKSSPSMLNIRIKIFYTIMNVSKLCLQGWQLKPEVSYCYYTAIQVENEQQTTLLIRNMQKQFDVWRTLW